MVMGVGSTDQIGRAGVLAPALPPVLHAILGALISESSVSN